MSKIGWAAFAPLLPLVCFALIAASAARADEPGVVTGTVMNGGKPLALTNGYFIETRKIPELAFENEPVTLVLLAADRPLPNDAIDESAFTRLAAGGKVRGLVLELNLAGSWIIHANGVLDDPAPSYSGNQTSKTMRVEAFTRTGDRIEAHLVGADGHHADPVFDFPAFDLHVVAQLRPAPRVPVPLLDDGARRSAPALAYAALLNAFQRNDIAAIRSGYQNGADMQAADMPMLRDWMLGGRKPSAIVAGIKKAYISEHLAQLVIADDQSTQVVALRRIADSWKLE